MTRTEAEDLATTFRAALTVVGSGPDDGAEAGPRAAEVVITGLLACWDEPHRAYHARRHLAETLSAHAALVTGPEPDTAEEVDAAVGVLALWFHDAVYEVGAGPGENEARSAERAERDLQRLAVDSGIRARVAALVTMTADHGALADPAAPAVHDADLWILAASPERFDAYCAQVREEYRAIPPDQYAQGRSRILRDLLDAPDGLYLTALGRTWTPTARANVQREIARLSGPDAD